MIFPGMGGQVKAMETRQQTSLRAFINRHAVLAFYTLVFALSWGPGSRHLGPRFPHRRLAGHRR
jgi:hypothetical protein